MFRREFIATAGALAASSLPGWAQAQASRAICYNCPPEWADWGGMLKLVNQKLNIAVPPDNKNSGQTLAALIAEKANPVADIAYFGGQFGPQARAADVLAPFKPTRFGDIPAGMKDPDGYWFTIHSGTLGLFVNTAALRGKPVPQSWRDLLKPEYKGLIGYLNPASAAVGQVGVIAVNLALGGSYENLDPGIAFFKQLQANQPIVPTQTSYARVLSGEIPILFDYDFNAYRAKYKDNAPVTFTDSHRGDAAVAVHHGPGGQGAQPRAGQEDSRLPAVRRWAAPLGKRLPAAGVRLGADAGDEGPVPAGCRLRARQAIGRVQAVRGEQDHRRALSEGSRLSGLPAYG